MVAIWGTCFQPMLGLREMPFSATVALALRGALSFPTSPPARPTWTRQPEKLYFNTKIKLYKNTVGEKPPTSKSKHWRGLKTAPTRAPGTEQPRPLPAEHVGGSVPAVWAPSPASPSCPCPATALQASAHPAPQFTPRPPHGGTAGPAPGLVRSPPGPRTWASGCRHPRTAPGAACAGASAPGCTAPPCCCCCCC